MTETAKQKIRDAQWRTYCAIMKYNGFSTDGERRRLVDPADDLAPWDIVAAEKPGTLLDAVEIKPDTKPDTSLRLADAARIAFPDGSVNVSTLRRLAANGLLTIHVIGRKHFTTLNDIERMKDKCHVQAKAHGSRSLKPKAAHPCGTSATASERSALGALKATAKRLKENLPTTSSASTTPEQAAAVVIPMPSKSRTP
jgi:hypothetical protein